LKRCMSVCEGVCLVYVCVYVVYVCVYVFQRERERERM